MPSTSSARFSRSTICSSWSILALNTDDDDAVALAEVRVEDRLAAQRRGGGDGHLLHREFQVARIRREVHEVHDSGPQRRLRNLDAADLIGRDHAIGAGAFQ